jgi:hypothetical protein
VIQLTTWLYYRFEEVLLCHGRRKLTRDDCSWCWRLTLIVENKKLAEERIFGNAFAR